MNSSDEALRQWCLENVPFVWTQYLQATESCEISIEPDEKGFAYAVRMVTRFRETGPDVALEFRVGPSYQRMTIGPQPLQPWPHPSQVEILVEGNDRMGLLVNQALGVINQRKLESRLGKGLKRRVEGLGTFIEYNYQLFTRPELTPRLRGRTLRFSLAELEEAEQRRYDRRRQEEEAQRQQRRSNPSPPVHVESLRAQFEQAEREAQRARVTLQQLEIQVANARNLYHDAAQNAARARAAYEAAKQRQQPPPPRFTGFPNDHQERAREEEARARPRFTSDNERAREEEARARDRQFQAEKQMAVPQALASFGLPLNATWRQVKDKWMTMTDLHPDKGGDPEQYKTILANYRLLEAHLRPNLTGAQHLHFVTHHWPRLRVYFM